MEYNLLEHLKTALAFTFLGLVLFGVAWLIIVKVTPFSIRKELEIDQNTALGIVLGERDPGHLHHRRCRHPRLRGSPWRTASKASLGRRNRRAPASTRPCSSSRCWWWPPAA